MRQREGRTLHERRVISDLPGIACVSRAGPCDGVSHRAHLACDKKGHVMETRDKTTGTRVTWIGISVLLVALLVVSAGPSAAWGGRGFGGFHGGRGFGGFHGGFHHGFHRFGGSRIAIGVGPFWGPSWGWGPYGYPYGYPYSYPYGYPYGSSPIVVAPSTALSVAPPPPASWYYCENPTGYYPYVQQCPGGWRPVAPTPP